MFKNFFILALTSVCGSMGVLPFTPMKVQEPIKQEQYYSSSYSGTGAGDETFTITINYDSIDDSNYTNVDYLCPSYSLIIGSNGCAPTAGSIVTSYYDLTYPNLLPNYEPIITYNNRVYWKTLDDTTGTMQETLYNYMGTNTEATGTSTTQFKNGMTRYYNEKGYNISYNNVVNSLTPANVITYLNQNKPIVLFITSYDYYSELGLNYDDTEMSMVCRRNTAGHTVVVCGYQQFKFYQNGVNFRTDNYAYVCFGDSSSGFLSLDDTSYIQEAYTFNITSA